MMPGPATAAGPGTAMMTQPGSLGLAGLGPGLGRRASEPGGGYEAREGPRLAGTVTGYRAAGRQLCQRHGHGCLSQCGAARRLSPVRAQAAPGRGQGPDCAPAARAPRSLCQE